MSESVWSAFNETTPSLIEEWPYNWIGQKMQKRTYTKHLQTIPNICET